MGERLAEALKSFAAGRFMPLEDFLRQDQNRFNRADRIHVNYQQAMALTVFLMQARDSAYRDDFLDYVRDAYRGRIKLGNGRSLEDRLDQPLKALETQFHEFLRSSGRERRGDQEKRAELVPGKGLSCPPGATPSTSFVARPEPTLALTRPRRAAAP